MILSNKQLMVLCYTIFIITLLAVTPVSAAEGDAPEMITDRPDQTESTATVPTGLIQIESGFIYTDTGESTVFEIPGTLVRVGVHKKVEMRIGTTGWIKDNDFDLDGFGDSELGFKVRLFDESGLIPESALLAGISVPAGSDDFTSSEWDPSLRFAAAHTISETVSFGWNIAAEWLSAKNSSGKTTTLAVMPYSGAFGFGFSDRFGCFAELFGEIPVNAGGGPSHMIDSGITYLMQNNFQFDLAVGKGLNDHADSFFLLGGITYRLPQ